ncbi:hypothetical protein ACIGXM_36710 [Kitasatospora sp. NPDC052896]|uniref:hypothetical protein n=1 Tax=Kitasatospora sp. NPDC052896 TaxID=3364061 RepID=UPI0037C90F01
MSEAFDPGEGMPPPPVRPGTYVSETDWKAFVQRVGGAKRDNVSLTSLVYDSGNGYHFTLQVEFADPRKQTIYQPHITHDTTKAVYYDARYTLSNAAQAKNNNAAAAWATLGLNYDALVRAFADAAEAMKKAFNASRTYDVAAEKYRNSYPWHAVLGTWVKKESAAGADLLILRQGGSRALLVERASDQNPCVIDVEKDIAKTIEMPGLTNYNFGYLDSHVRAVSEDGRFIGFITRAKLATRRNATHGSNSPERRLLNQLEWAQKVKLRIADAVTEEISTSGPTDGRRAGQMLLFRHGDVHVRADTAWTDGSKAVRDRAAFEQVVSGHVDAELSLWVPSTEPNDGMFLGRARDAVRKLSAGSRFIVAGGTTWVVPSGALQKAEAQHRVAALPRLQVVEKYVPGGTDTGRIIVTLGGSHFHTPASLRPAEFGEKDDDSGFCLLVTQKGGIEKPCKRPDDLQPLDFARYSWIATLPDAGSSLVRCGASNLVTLSDDECLYVYDDVRYYREGGDCFVPTGTVGAQRLRHPGTGEVVAIDPNSGAKVTVVADPLVLPRSGQCVLANAQQEYVLCDTSALVTVPPAFGASIVAVKTAGTIRGFLDLTSAPALTAQHLIDHAGLPARTTADYDDALGRYIRQDPHDGSLTSWAYLVHLSAPMKSDEPALRGFLQRVVTAPEGVAIVDGTGQYDGAVTAVSLEGELELYEASVVHWLTQGADETECVVVYADGADWDDSACVTVLERFAAGCDLIVRDQGAFQGYANSGTASHARHAVMAVTGEPRSGGHHSHAPAYPMADRVPQREPDTMHFVTGPGRPSDAPCLGVAVRANPSLQHYLEHLARGGAWYVVIGDDGGRLLCAPDDAVQDVLVLPASLSLDDAVRRFSSDSTDEAAVDWFAELDRFEW